MLPRPPQLFQSAMDLFASIWHPDGQEGLYRWSGKGGLFYSLFLRGWWRRQRPKKYTPAIDAGIPKYHKANEREDILPKWNFININFPVNIIV